MKKILLILLFTFLVFINHDMVFSAVLDGTNIWLNNVFPSLFPFFLISQYLINYNFVYYVSILLKPLMSLLKTNNNCAYILVLSLLTGFPSSAKYTKELLNKGLINEYDANKVILFTHFANPLFIINMTSSLNLSLIILISHYIPNIIIAFLFRNYHQSNKKMDNYKIKSKKFSILFSTSIKDSIDTLLLILGTIVTFKIISIVLLSTFNFNNLFSCIIQGLLEITQGINGIKLLNISNKLKGLIITSFLSFGGLSVHMQISAILSDTKIKYSNFLKARILHTFLSCFIYLVITLIH